MTFADAERNLLMHTPRNATMLAMFALVVAVAVAALVPPKVVYPDYCSTSAVSGPFCISYDPALGRYENPPPNVPGDVSAFANSNARPNEIRGAIGALVFMAFVAAGWFGARFRRRAHVTFADAD